MKHSLENITISKASPADIPQMVAVINAVYRGESSKQGWTTEADLIAGDIRTDEEDIAQLMALPTTTFLIAVHRESGLVGSVFLSLKEDKKLYLGMLSVHLDWQAAGIGRKMLSAAESLAISLGCTAMTMQVIVGRSELTAWYERNGYRATGERKPFDGPSKFGVPKVPLEFAIYEKPLG
ncbi:MAG: GNAT family N-acetyltransferase [Saprospiraceae bacterium]|nr:GNAT family N-acetyltransferase [Saprospiraceae bacterium]